MNGYSPMTTIKDDAFQRCVIESDKIVIVFIYSRDCGSCTIAHSVLKKVKNRINSDVHILKMNFNNNIETLVKYGVVEVPTILIFQRGDLIKRMVGLFSFVELDHFLQSVLHPENGAG